MGGRALGYQPTNVWAPSVSRRGRTFNLYYALSSFGSNASAIGLMTNPSFDVAKPGEGWKDEGLVLMSKRRRRLQRHRPVPVDLADGRAFLAFGSFWSGIKLHRTGPESGKPKPDAPVDRAGRASWRRDRGRSQFSSTREIHLFVSFDQCCKGVASTYNIRVGRADRVEGPYLDRDGKAMLEGGGSLMLGTTGRFIGPGGQEPVRSDQRRHARLPLLRWRRGGVAKLQLSPIRWSADGWPELDPLPQ